MIVGLSIFGLILSVIPGLMFLRNVRLFCVPLDLDPKAEKPWVSVLIPARDEEQGIAKTINAALASEHVELEVIVLDDHSSDTTPTIVNELAEQDKRVRYVLSKALPDGWNGKQFACYQLAQQASYEHIVFLDADVRLMPDAIAKLIARKQQTDVGLLSAFPKQETGTWLEKWIIPMMHFILLGYLPMHRMRGSTHPAYASGCGQLFLTTKEQYQKAGTHQAIQASRHDGIKLPKTYRTHGLSTDVIDGTSLASCRMYQNAGQVVRGILKNATEGIANSKTIVIFSILLIGGVVLPVATLLHGIVYGMPLLTVISIIGVALGHLPRLVGVLRFSQPISGVLFHSAATLLFVVLQWVAFVGQLSGRQVKWRGRN